MEEDTDFGSDRPETVREAAGFYDDDDDNEIAEAFEEDTVRVWVTLLDSKGNARHQYLNQISEDLIAPTQASLKQLKTLDAAAGPQKRVVSEGMWISPKNKEIGYGDGWGAVQTMPRLQRSWKGRTVHWAENGYAEQCRVSNLPGVPMSDDEEQRPPVVGPLDQDERRGRLEALITACGFPSLEEIEPHYSDDPTLDLLDP